MTVTNAGETASIMGQVQRDENDSLYSLNQLTAAAEKLATAETFQRGMRALVQNYGLLNEGDCLVVSGCNPEQGFVYELYANGHTATLFPPGLSRPIENTGSAFFLDRNIVAVELDQLKREANTGNIDFATFVSKDVKSVVGTPVIWQNRSIGTVQLLRRSGSSGVHTKFVKNLAVLLAPHMALVRDSQRVKVIQSHLSALSEISSLVGQSSDLGLISDRVASYLHEFVGYDSVVIRIRNSDNNQSLPFYTKGEFDLSLLTNGEDDEIGNTLSELSIRSDGPFCVTVAGAVDQSIEHSALERFLEHVPSVLVAPLKDSHGFLGTIECYSLNEWAYGANDIGNFKRLAELLSHGITQHKLIESMSNQIGIRATMADLARGAAIGSDPKRILATITAKLQNIISFDRLTFYLPEILVSLLDQDQSYGACSRFSVFPFSAFLDTAHQMSRGLVNNPEAGFRKEFVSSAELWTPDDTGGANLALFRDSPITAEETALLEEAARHVAPAVKNLILHTREIQLIEQQTRADRAELSVKHLENVAVVKRETLSTITHELRTPLTAISAFVDILEWNRPGNLTPVQTRNLDAIKRGASALSNIVTDLDELNSIELNEFSLNYATADMSQLARDAVADTRPLAQVTKHKVRLTLPRTEVSGAADGARLGQVLRNLLNNAMKYSEPGTILRILLRKERDRAHFYVKDEGVGIPKDEQDGLFNLFSRAQSSAKSSVNGSGIGLYVCKKIVETHEGQIFLHSVPGKGTTVHFWIPLK